MNSFIDTADTSQWLCKMNNWSDPFTLPLSLSLFLALSHPHTVIRSQSSVSISFLSALAILIPVAIPPPTSLPHCTLLLLPSPSSILTSFLTPICWPNSFSPFYSPLALWYLPPLTLPASLISYTTIHPPNPLAPPTMTEPWAQGPAPSPPPSLWMSPLTPFRDATSLSSGQVFTLKGISSNLLLMIKLVYILISSGLSAQSRNLF